MARLFDRTIRVVAAGREFKDLRIAFRVVRSLKPEPNPAELSIWNLNEDSRTLLSGPKSVPVLIEAGYDGNHELLFKGDLRAARTTRAGADWVTTLRAGDGEASYRTAKINESFKPGTKIKDVAKALAKSLGVSLGDAEKKIDAALHHGGLEDYAKGKAVSGFVKDHLTSILDGLGLTWSIQDGALQIVGLNEVTKEEAIELGPTTGMVGSPAPGDKGVTKVKSLLQPGLRPGRKVKLETRGLTGFYRVEQAVHAGDTHGRDWYSEIEARPL